MVVFGFRIGPIEVCCEAFSTVGRVVPKLARSDCGEFFLDFPYFTLTFAHIPTVERFYRGKRKAEQGGLRHEHERGGAEQASGTLPSG